MFKPEIKLTHRQIEAPILRNSLERLLNSLWYSPRAYSACWGYLLSPLAWLYGCITQYKKRSALAGQKTDPPPPARVVVVGNITAGGTGKTPLLIALASALCAEGRRVGILSRGYGGSYIERGGRPQWVSCDSDPDEVGDEAVLIAQSLQRDAGLDCPVVVCPDRLQAMHWLCQQRPCEILLADDGLQHYRLPRHIELAVIDGARGLGNGKLLPAGPLRESPERLATVDAIICNGQPHAKLASALATVNTPRYTMALTTRGLRPINRAASDGSETLASLRQRDCNIHAVAGIGNPARFFNTLREDLPAAKLSEHRYPDHYRYSEKDFHYSEESHSGAGQSAIVMTTKDAVKCYRFADNIDTPIYALEVSAEIDTGLYQRIRQQLDHCQ